jgi:hypothetical protein
MSGLVVYYPQMKPLAADSGLLKVSVFDSKHLSTSQPWMASHSYAMCQIDAPVLASTLFKIYPSNIHMFSGTATIASPAHSDGDT